MKAIRLAVRLWRLVLLKSIKSGLVEGRGRPPPIGLVDAAPRSIKARRGTIASATTRRTTLRVLFGRVRDGRIHINAYWVSLSGQLNFRRVWKFHPRMLIVRHARGQFFRGPEGSRLGPLPLSSVRPFIGGAPTPRRRVGAQLVSSRADASVAASADGVSAGIGLEVRISGPPMTTLSYGEMEGVRSRNVSATHV